MNIWMVNFILDQKISKIRYKVIKKLYKKILYTFKYKYKYMDNLILSFENLFILLEYNNYKININDSSIRMNIKLKNIIYIDNDQYSIRINIDKISWTMDMRIKDLNDFNVYYIDSSLKEPINKKIPENNNLNKNIYILFKQLFTDLFENFINEI